MRSRNRDVMGRRGKGGKGVDRGCFENWGWIDEDGE